jgi:hypothetical protein
MLQKTPEKQFRGAYTPIWAAPGMAPHTRCTPMESVGLRPNKIRYYFPFFFAVTFFFFQIFKLLSHFIIFKNQIKFIKME